MLIQLHMLQNYAPSNLNRDDTGAPKDAIFGNVLRGRISSQCLKRNIRKSLIFEEAFKKNGLLGDRTKRLPQIIFDQLKAMKEEKGLNDDDIQAIVAKVNGIGRESKKPAKGEDNATVDGAGNEDDVAETIGSESKDETKQLIFIDQKVEARNLAEKLLEIYTKLGAKGWAKAKIPDITKELEPSVPRSVDIAMFGRMTTSQAFKNVQAAVQVAHALSTNTLKTEFDYYTAIDDLKPDSKPGADMIGDVEFNSCTYYKYLNIHWEELIKNLGDDKDSKDIARCAVLTLLEAAALAHPTGKQNSFGAFNPPDFILVEVSQRNLPVSYVNAFLTPVRGYSDVSLLANSVEALSDYVDKLSNVYNLKPYRAHISVQGTKFLGAPPKPSLEHLKNWLDEQLFNA